MATLEDAAEQLVVKLKGLDSEIEESQQALEQGRERVEEVTREVAEEWSALTEAVKSLLARLREDQEQLAAEGRKTGQASADARGAVQDRGSEARSEAAEGEARLEALAQRASGLEPGVEGLVSEAGEEPARSLAERAREIDDQLAQVLQEACAFLRDEVATALDELAADVRERCQVLRAALVDEGVAALQEAFDTWEPKVDELEDYVSEQGFLASHSHARAVVDWALQECAAASEECLATLDADAERAVSSLKELADVLQAAATALAASGTELTAALAPTPDAAGQALAALDAVGALLASYSFMEK